MSFGNNVVFYRKKFQITQEHLAELLDVSRQTVSRWETDSAFPEMEKLLALCELFHCDLDTLVRGDAAAQNADENKDLLEAHEQHMNLFIRCITSGVCLILLGLSAIMFLNSATLGEPFSVAVFLSFVTIAVGIFVASGVSHSNFLREHPIAPEYPREQVKNFMRKMPFLYAIGIVCILLGVICTVMLEGERPNQLALFSLENRIVTGIFFLFLTVGVGFLVYAGMKTSQYTSDKKQQEEADTEETAARSKVSRIAEAARAITMMIATIIFLLLGFLFHWWHIAWVVFPIFGIVCGIISIIEKAMDNT